MVNHFKYALSDEASFERDEWGPWITKEVMTNDVTTGEPIVQKVARTDPDGVQLVRSYPSVHECPGLEDWLDLESWKAGTVFNHLKKISQPCFGCNSIMVRVGNLAHDTSIT